MKFLSLQSFVPSGRIDGSLHGDTLIAGYKFMSEGVQSVRKVMFLITDSAATEVYEATELKNEKTVLKKGPILQKVTCPLQ